MKTNNYSKAIYDVKSTTTLNVEQNDNNNVYLVVSKIVKTDNDKENPVVCVDNDYCNDDGND